MNIMPLEKLACLLDGQMQTMADTAIKLNYGLRCCSEIVPQTKLRHERVQTEIGMQS